MGQILKFNLGPQHNQLKQCVVADLSYWTKTAEIRHTKNQQVVESGKRCLVSGAYISLYVYKKKYFSYVSIDK